MSKFHSTVTRRNFMKGLGLGVAGIGAAVASAPVFHDLDEVMSADRALQKFPWWIKSTDEPTIEIDWSKVVRSDVKNNGHDGIFYGEQINRFGDRINGYPGQLGLGRKAAEDYIKSKFSSWKGDTLRDQALGESAWSVDSGIYGYYGFECRKRTYSPGEYSLPRWQGTPEENYIMVRNILRFLGTHITGVFELDQNTRKVFHANRPGWAGGQDVVFEDTDWTYQNATKLVQPNKNKYLIVATFESPTILSRRWPSLQGNLAVLSPFNLLYYAQAIMLEFLYGIGYEGNIVAEITNSEPCAILGGVGENSRMSFDVVSPLTGGMAEAVLRLTTDLPMATTKPIDGGVNRFCKTCKMCADACAYSAILYDDDTSWENPTPGTPPGFKGWRYEPMKCAHCGAGCQAVCPFNAPRESWIHTFVTATVATTPIFNSFFANMERTFGYDMWEPESFWTEDASPVLGFPGSFLETSDYRR